MHVGIAALNRVYKELDNLSRKKFTFSATKKSTDQGCFLIFTLLLKDVKYNGVSNTVSTARNDKATKIILELGSNTRFEPFIRLPLQLDSSTSRFMLILPIL